MFIDSRDKLVLYFDSKTKKVVGYRFEAEDICLSFHLTNYASITFTLSSIVKISQMTTIGLMIGELWHPEVIYQCSTILRESLFLDLKNRYNVDFYTITGVDIANK